MLPVTLNNAGQVHHCDSYRRESKFGLFLLEQHTVGNVPSQLNLEDFVDGVHKTLVGYDDQVHRAARLLHQVSQQASQLEVKRRNVVEFVVRFCLGSGVDQDYCQIDEIEARAGDIVALDQLVRNNKGPDIWDVEVGG